MLPLGPWGTLSLQLCLPRPPVAAGLADGWMSPALNRSSCWGRRMDAMPRAAGLIPDPPTREHGVGESPGASDSGRLRLDFRCSFVGLWPGNLPASVYPSVNWGQRWLSSM